MCDLLHMVASFSECTSRPELHTVIILLLFYCVTKNWVLLSICMSFSYSLQVAGWLSGAMEQADRVNLET